MTVAQQAFILCAELFALSFAAIAAIWLADRWRRGSGPQWTTAPKRPDTNRRQLIQINTLPSKIDNGDVSTAERSADAVPAVSGAVRFWSPLPGGLAIIGPSMPKRPKRIWYVSFDQPYPKRRHVRNAQAFASESEAKQFTGEALASGKVVYAGTINPHQPRRFIPPKMIDEWLNERHQGEHDPLIQINAVSDNVANDDPNIAERS